MTKFRGNRWAVLLVVSLGFLMTLLDLTIVNIAIPDMIARLHASLDDVLWVINAYTLVLAVVLITAGRLGDLIGQRVIFILGIVLFTAASAACGLAPGPGARAAGGLPAGMSLSWRTPKVCSSAGWSGAMVLETTHFCVARISSANSRRIAVPGGASG